jgi:hypothetical protein
MSALLKAPPQTRTATHDGYIWPLDRVVMTDPNAIADRMCEDAVSLYFEHGLVEQAALERLGWSQRQLALFGNRAMALVEQTLALSDFAAPGGA